MFVSLHERRSNEDSERYIPSDERPGVEELLGTTAL